MSEEQLQLLLKAYKRLLKKGRICCIRCGTIIQKLET